MPKSIKKKIKILHIITALPTGGAQMMLYKLLSKTNLEKFEPIVVSLMDEGTIGCNIESMGIPLYSLKLKKRIPLPFGIVNLFKIIKNCKPDVIQGWMYHGNLLATISSLFIKKKIPVIWNIRHSLHDIKKEKRLTNIVIRLCGIISGLPKRIIYNSKCSIKQHQLIGYRENKSVFIPNGFDVKNFKFSEDLRKRIRQELNFSEDIPVVGIIARYHPMKGHDKFLEAAAIISRAEKVKFVLVGKNADSENEELKAHIDRLNLKNDTLLLGERNDITSIMSGIDILVSSSSWGEGFPNVLGEAMACELPCVATDIGDCDFILDRFGKIVNPGDPVALANATLNIMRMKESEKKRIALESRNRIEKYFSIDRIVQNYEDLYLAVVQENMISR